MKKSVIVDAAKLAKDVMEVEELEPVAAIGDGVVAFWPANVEPEANIPILVYPDFSLVCPVVSSSNAGNGWWTDDGVKMMRWR